MNINPEQYKEEANKKIEESSMVLTRRLRLVELRRLSFELQTNFDTMRLLPGPLDE